MATKKDQFVTQAAAQFNVNRKLVGLIVDEWERTRKRPATKKATAAKKAPAKRKATAK